MPPSKQPKVLLFDVGGVCVLSPMQAILDYELSHSIPPGWINHSISTNTPNGFWHRLERGELKINDEFFTGFKSDLHDASTWERFYQRKARKSSPTLPATTPPLPTMDTTWIFWEMMRVSRDFDPWMYPALQKLKASGKYILAALSNTVPFDEGHPYGNPEPEKDIRNVFDIFVASSSVGLRKPDPKIYAYALKEVNGYALANATGRGKSLGWSEGVKPEEIVFSDDIGENLKAAKKFGFQTIKVHLGRAYEAVDELEKITGLELAGGHPRVPITPVIKKTGAKL